MPLYSGIFTLSQASLAAKNSTWTGIAPPVVEYLIVAGGGSSGGSSTSGSACGGGGAGGLLQGSAGILPSTAYNVTVGAGGAGPTPASYYQVGNNGNNSVFDATSSGASTGRIVATGGGGGGTGGGGFPANNGGSGGGGGYVSASTGGTGIPGQGNAGANGPTGGSGGYASGGGGAGTAGIQGVQGSCGGQGGGGIASDITGTRVTYAGGGGGAGAVSPGAGGAGGGGNSATAPYGTVGTNGATNTGGGGGGSYAGTGSNGGSGIVVIRYPDYYTAPTATTGSPTAATIGPASISLNGTNQSLTIASNAAFAYGTGDFTWEAWIYPTSASWTTGNFYILDHGSNNGVLQYYQNKLNYYNGTDGSISPAAATISSMTWTHVAVARSSGTLRMFVNGALITSASSNHNYAAQAVTVGNFGGGGSYNFAGYVTNLRLVKGTAVYTAAFTPATAPLTAVTNTSLLLNANYWAPFTDTSSNGFSVTANNSPTVFNSSPFNWVGSGAGYRVYSWTSSGTVTF